MLRLNQRSIWISPKENAVLRAFRELVAHRAVGSGVGSVVAPAIAQTISNPMTAKAALVQGINDAWVVLALITLVPLLLIRSANPIQREPAYNRSRKPPAAR
jgi:hypothetical protein